MALSTKVPDSTPVIIGVGQYSERVGEPSYGALSYMDLAGRALFAGIADTGASGDVAEAIDTLAAIRAFEMSRPDRTPPFGAASNVPRAIASRVGANPARAILTTTGGQTNQQLVGEFAHAIAAGDSQCAVIVGSEAISTVLALSAKGETPDWSEDVPGDCEDQGFGVEDLLEPALFAHGASGAIPLYALAENARRAKLGMGLEQYRLEIGRLFAPFTRVAAANPHSAAPVERTAEELATVTQRNRIVAEPYPRMTVARDQVNQAAAIIVASAGLARALGVPRPDPFTLRLTITPAHISRIIPHVPNTTFVQWLETMAVNHSDSLGFDGAWHRQRDLIWFVRRHEIDYRAAALAGDRLLCATWPTFMKAATAHRQHEIRRAHDGAVIARGLNVWGYVDIQTGRPLRMPPEVLDAFDPARFV